MNVDSITRMKNVVFLNSLNQLLDAAVLNNKCSWIKNENNVYSPNATVEEKLLFCTEGLQIGEKQIEEWNFISDGENFCNTKVIKDVRPQLIVDNAAFVIETTESVKDETGFYNNMTYATLYIYGKFEDE